MIVSELIIELQKYPGDTEVMREDCGDYGDVQPIRSVVSVTLYGTSTYWTPRNPKYREWFKDRGHATNTAVMGERPDPKTKKTVALVGSE